MAKNTGSERIKNNPIELRKKRGSFLHNWPFNLFAHLIKWNSTLCHTFFLKNMISPIRRFLHYLYWTSLCRCSARFFSLIFETSSDCGFSGHNATFSLMWSRDLCDWFLIKKKTFWVDHTYLYWFMCFVNFYKMLNIQPLHVMEKESIHANSTDLRGSLPKF